jgi:predicted ATPase/DNA-binding SARP family transcriptional activator
VAPVTTVGTLPDLRWRYVSRTLPDAGASDRTRVQLCGRLSVELDGVELAGSLRGKQVPLLLAYLVLTRNRSVGREELIGALWPHNAPQSQDAALRTLLSRLRSALGRSVLAGRDELVLELPEPAWVDVEAATSHVARADEALHAGDARGAWALAQVPLNIASRGLLPGAQASWLDVFRRDLSDVRLHALEVIGRAGLVLGGTQLGSVQRAARALIEAEPYRESGYVLLMESLQAQGNVAEGLRVFDRLRTLLREELGTAPSPEAIATHQQLLNPPRRSAAPAPTHTGPGPAALPLPAELRPRAAGTMIGRVAELAEIERWLAGGRRDPQTRTERLLLVSGDPGIGKTRLLAEVATRAHATGTLVLAGWAPEETLVPFQPFLEALGHYVSAASVEELRETAREYGAELLRLLPELRRRLPELPPTDTGDSETERYRLFEAVVGLLGRVSASVPVLIVLDDIHWADRPTLMLLRHLARAPQAQGLSIIGGYRSTERSSEAFGMSLASLRHDRLVTQVDLRGLPEREAARLVALRVGGPPTEDFAHALYAETEGNPFFIEEILRHLDDAGVEAPSAGASDLRRFGLPDDVRDVISRRIGRLSDDAIESMRVASVIGRDFDGALLERVLDIDEERFLGALDESLAGRLVDELESRPGHYGFTHALIRETLYGGMSTARRARMHRRVGVALEEMVPNPSERHVNELAHHFTRAASPQDAERAVRYAMQAGEQASLMLAHEEAAEHYARALEVLEQFQPDETARRCEVLIELGEARVRSGERPQAWPVFREAAALAAELGDGEALARAAIGASRRYVQPPGVVDQDLIGLLEQALEMAAGERSVKRVLLLARLTGALYYSDQRDRMRRLSAEATVIAAELRDPQARALAAAARRRAYWGPGHLERRLSDSTQLLQAAQEADDIDLMLQGHAWLAVDLLEAGDRTAVEAQIGAFNAGARRLRQPLFTWQSGVWSAMKALLAGHLSTAERLAAEALAAGIRPEGVTAPQYYAIQMLAIRREQARMAELETATRDLVAANPNRPAWRAGLATLLAETGRLDEAQPELDALAAKRFEDVPEDGDWMIAMTLLADVATELGDAERAALLHGLLLPYRKGSVVVGIAAVCLGSTARYLGRLALVMGDTGTALGHLELALRSNTALRASVQLAHTQLDYAAALGPGTKAREHVAAAEKTAQELHLPAVERRLEKLRAL